MSTIVRKPSPCAQICGLHNVCVNISGFQVISEYANLESAPDFAKWTKTRSCARGFVIAYGKNTQPTSKLVDNPEFTYGKQDESRTMFGAE